MHWWSLLSMFTEELFSTMIWYVDIFCQGLHCIKALFKTTLDSSIKNIRFNHQTNLEANALHGTEYFHLIWVSLRAYGYGGGLLSYLIFGQVFIVLSALEGHQFASQVSSESTKSFSSMNENKQFSPNAYASNFPFSFIPPPLSSNFFHDLICLKATPLASIGKLSHFAPLFRWSNSETNLCHGYASETIIS